MRWPSVILPFLRARKTVRSSLSSVTVAVVTMGSAGIVFLRLEVLDIEDKGTRFWMEGG